MTTGRYFNRNFVDQERMGRYIQNAKRKKKLSTKNTIPKKTVFYKWGRAKEFHEQTEAEGV